MNEYVKGQNDKIREWLNFIESSTAGGNEIITTYSIIESIARGTINDLKWLKE